MEYTKVSANAFDTLQINAGIVVTNFQPGTGWVTGVILGATSGGISFASNPEWYDVGESIDNVPGSTWQLKRVKGYAPALSGTFKTITAARAKQLNGSGAVSSGHIVPAEKLTAADFSDVWFVGDYSATNKKDPNGARYTDAGFCAIHIMNAHSANGFQWKSNDDGDGEFAFEFHGHYSLTSIGTAPYEIYIKAGVDQRLKSLSATNTAFDFDPDVHEYTVNFDGASTVISAEAFDEDAEITIVAQFDNGTAKPTEVEHEVGDTIPMTYNSYPLSGIVVEVLTPSKIYPAHYGLTVDSE